MTDKHLHVAEIIQHLAAEFINLESNRVSLITVTNVDLAKDMGNAIILLSVFPEERQSEVLAFMQRKRSEFRDYVKTHSRLKRMPRFTFELDLGEKNRQRIDALLQE